MIANKNINKIILIVFSLFIATFCFGADDGVTINQVVEPSCNYNSICETDLAETYFTCPSDCNPVGSLCNNNTICEPSLGESVSTCPSDCVGGGGTIHPAVVQEGLEGEPIEIFDIQVSTGIGATTISWETNKPTKHTLIFGYGRSGDEEVYSGELYTEKHYVVINDLDFRDEYFFKIFSEGIYGDNNFGYAELFVIKQNLDKQIDELKKDDPLGSKDDSTSNLEDVVSSKIIESSDEDLKYPIIAPTGGVCEDAICGFESFGQFWGDFRCTVEKSVWFSFLLEYFWQLALFIIIILIGFNLIKSDEKGQGAL